MIAGAEDSKGISTELQNAPKFKETLTEEYTKYRKGEQKKERTTPSPCNSAENFEMEILFSFFKLQSP